MNKKKLASKIYKVSSKIEELEHEIVSTQIYITSWNSVDDLIKKLSYCSFSTMILHCKTGLLLDLKVESLYIQYENLILLHKTLNNKL